MSNNDGDELERLENLFTQHSTPGGPIIENPNQRLNNYLEGYDIVKSIAALSVTLVTTIAALSIWSLNPNWKTGIFLGLVLLVIFLGVLRIVRGSEDTADEAAAARLRIPIRPSRRARRILVSNEEMWKETRQHPMVLSRWWIGIILVTVIALVFPDNKYLPWVWLAAITVVAGRVLVWFHNHFCFTNMRVFLLIGLFSTKAPFMPLSKVTDATLIVPWHSKLLAYLRIINLRYGTFDFESAGQKQGVERLSWVPAAEIVNRQLVQEVLSPTDTDSPG
jgi:hypothetical protein